MRPQKAFLTILTIAALAALVLCSVPRSAELTVTFTSPGDNALDSLGNFAPNGTPARYLIYFSRNPFDSLTFGQADTASFCATPHPAGAIEVCTITGLQFDKVYYLMARAVDEAGNWSPPGNVIQARTPDLVPPAAILNLSLMSGQ